MSDIEARDKMRDLGLLNGTPRDNVIEEMSLWVKKRAVYHKAAVYELLVANGYKGADSTVDQFYMIYLAMELGLSINPQVE